MKKTTLFLPALGVMTVYMAMGPVRMTLAKENNNSNGKSWKNEMRKELRKENQNVMKTYKPALMEAKLDSISGTTLMVSKDSKSYSVNTDSNTVFVKKMGGVAKLTDFQVGDILNIRGTFVDDAKTTVMAKYIRDVSIFKRQAAFEGIIKSVDGNNLVVITKGKGDVAFVVSGDTKYLQKGKVVTLSEVTVGTRVNVWGIWDSNLKKLVETSRVIIQKKA